MVSCRRPSRPLQRPHLHGLHVEFAPDQDQDVVLADLEDAPVLMKAKTATPPQNLPHTYSRGVRRVAGNTSPTFSSRSRITVSPEMIARNSAPSEMSMTAWTLLWPKTEVRCGRPASPPPEAMVTEPSDCPSAKHPMRTRRIQ